MNGYLNNLTLRTLNAGNRVEPRLPGLFEPEAVVERRVPLEQDVTMVSEGEAPSHGPGVEKTEMKVSSVEPPQSRRGDADDDDPETGFEPISYADEQEDPVETVNVQATLQPQPKNIEIPTSRVIATSRVIEDPEVETAFEEFEEHLTPALEIDDSVLLAPVPSAQRQQQTPTSHRIRRTNPDATPPAFVSTPSPKTTNELHAHLTFNRTTLPRGSESTAAPLEAPIEPEILQINQKLTNNPEHEPDFEPAEPLTYRRVNPTPATWRRGGPSPAPVEPEPSINVTIGRIEVRAVPADNRKATTPRRSESPVMPLEDYLRKQRRGGER